VQREPLEQLFERHFDNPRLALERFRFRLSVVKFDFEIERNLTEFQIPDDMGFPTNLPSWIYYHIPGTRFGSVRTFGKNPTIANHLYSSDGIGLNCGCPVRLARALDVLFSLNPEDRFEPMANLQTCRNHLAAVEELLWLTLWKEVSQVARGGELINTPLKTKGKDVDWFILTRRMPIFLEVKFRQTDWMRQADQDMGQIGNNFFADIGSKLPKEIHRFQKCIAGITGYAEPDDSFYAGCEKKLVATPGLTAILYRSLLGPIHVCGLEPMAVKEIGVRLREPKLGEYPGMYPINFRRVLQHQRLKTVARDAFQEKGRLFECVVPRPAPIMRPKYPLRFKIPKWTATGQPVFENVPAFLPRITSN